MLPILTLPFRPSEFLNELSESINIFDNDEIIKFVDKDSEELFIRNMRRQYAKRELAKQGYRPRIKSNASPHEGTNLKVPVESDISPLTSKKVSKFFSGDLSKYFGVGTAEGNRVQSAKPKNDEKEKLRLND